MRIVFALRIVYYAGLFYNFPINTECTNAQQIQLL